MKPSSILVFSFDSSILLVISDLEGRISHYVIMFDMYWSSSAEYSLQSVNYTENRIAVWNTHELNANCWSPLNIMYDVRECHCLVAMVQTSREQAGNALVLF